MYVLWEISYIPVGILFIICFDDLLNKNQYVFQSYENMCSITLKNYGQIPENLSSCVPKSSV